VLWFNFAFSFEHKYAQNLKLMRREYGNDLSITLSMHAMSKSIGNLISCRWRCGTFWSYFRTKRQLHYGKEEKKVKV
jgi:hypothetical protein